jgi:hypothetical protein
MHGVQIKAWRSLPCKRAVSASIGFWLCLLTACHSSGPRRVSRYRNDMATESLAEQFSRSIERVHRWLAVRQKTIQHVFADAVVPTPEELAAYRSAKVG